MSDAARDTEPFTRPGYNHLDRLFNQCLPPQPTGQRRYNAPQNLRATRHDYLIVLRQLLITAVVCALQIWLVRWTAQPPVVLLANLFWWLQPLLGTGFGIVRWLVIITLCAYLFSIAWRDPGVSLSRISLGNYRRYLPRSVWTLHLSRVTNTIATEEQWYREGAEHWSPRQRWSSSLVFGFGHMSNLFYPIASYLALSLLGHTLSRVYLHELRRTGSTDKALARTIVIHRLYNWTLLGMIPPYIMVLIALA